MRFGVRGRRAAEADVDVVHARALARLELEPHHPLLAGGIDFGVDARREVALGGGGLARLAHRLVEQALEPFGIHFRIAAPALEVEALLQHALQVARRLDLDAIVQPRERRRRKADEHDQGGAHGR